MWIDPLHYAWAAVMVNQFEGRNLMVEGNIEVRTYVSADSHVYAQPISFKKHAEVTLGCLKDPGGTKSAGMPRKHCMISSSAA